MHLLFSYLVFVLGCLLVMSGIIGVWFGIGMVDDIFREGIETCFLGLALFLAGIILITY